MPGMLETIAPVESPFQLRGSLFTLSVLQLNETELPNIERELKHVISKAPKFFDHAPVVIDLQKLYADNTDVDYQGLCQTLRKQNMIPVGVRGGTQKQHETAKKQGLAILSLAKSEEPTLSAQQKVENKKPSSADEAKTSASSINSAKSVLITKPVRSGQQYYAKDGDLVIVGPVSQGAELLADGNIHVYGPLRGRALAGINGNTNARIFCNGMEAELVSIAGRYIVNETIAKQQSNVPQQVLLEDGKLKITSL